MQGSGLSRCQPKGPPERDPEGGLAAEANFLRDVGNLAVGHQQKETGVEACLQSPLAKGHTCILVNQARQRPR